MLVGAVVAASAISLLTLLRRADRRRSGVDAAGLRRARAITDSAVDLRRGGGSEGP